MAKRLQDLYGADYTKALKERQDIVNANTGNAGYANARNDASDIEQNLNRANAQAYLSGTHDMSGGLGQRLAGSTQVAQARGQEDAFGAAYGLRQKRVQDANKRVAEENAVAATNRDRFHNTLQAFGNGVANGLKYRAAQGKDVVQDFRDAKSAVGNLVNRLKNPRLMDRGEYLVSRGEDDEDVLNARLAAEQEKLNAIANGEVPEEKISPEVKDYRAKSPLHASPSGKIGSAAYNAKEKIKALWNKRFYNRGQWLTRNAEDDEEVLQQRLAGYAAQAEALRKIMEAR